MKEITPNFQTPNEDLNEIEQFKLRSGIIGNLAGQFTDTSVDDVEHETEALAKSHGIYMEFNRAKTGKEKDWMYMIRISIPGGGPMSREQYAILDDIGTEFTISDDGFTSLRLTTRQNIQYHWVQKKDLVKVVQRIASSDFYSINGCGDNVRNVMGCPMSRFSNVYNANAMAQKFGEYFQLPLAPHMEVFAIDPKYIRNVEESYQYGDKLLNRKFKIAFSAVHQDEKTGLLVPDNCVELRTNDMGIAPVIENGKVEYFQIYVGGGQGERNGKASFASLGKPIGIVHQDDLLKALDSVVKVHEDFGDRQSRHWARVKYVMHIKGPSWYREQVKNRGVDIEAPNESLDIGARHLHHGWMKQPSNGLWSYGAFIECGRLIDKGDIKFKSMVRQIMDKWDVQLMVTANQDLIFTDIAEDAKEDFEAELKTYGHGQRNGKAYSNLRLRSGACVALPTCRLAYTDSERFISTLVDELDEKGYGDMTESIGITGCERQCFRPATKTIGWVGSGKNMYQLKVMGSEDGSTQGRPLVGKDQLMHMRMVPRDKVSTVVMSLFDAYKANRESESETMGQYHQRIGLDAIIAHLKSDPNTQDLMEKTFKPLYLTPD